ncbi:Retrovirus-related Pol polyprotein from transposon 17.6 [Vitis vinifera]|uniref:Retrovirus-related Pol polyprotein from transposon 17.6 n=1 Tax=Vitis vinifera TaxID=29760 RepID=A0A438JDI7_VITVI|nr:Retrovirus-related Pol polyprotein from transposon 17.6 [Vitis vinifera]
MSRITKLKERLRFACYPAPWRRREEILPLFNEEETQRAAKEEPPKLILKPLPTELKYAYLEEDKKCLLLYLQLLPFIRRIVYLKSLEDDEAKPVRQPQRRLNPHMQEVVRAEVLKLLQAGIIYPISDSPWVSPTQVVPKKSGITVVQNDKGEDVSTRLTTGWRVCIDYRRLNAVTRNDHFPLPFIDQENAFRLCNAPATFQRCMLSIFSDMVERIMEVFMDDITIYGSAFDECLVNLEAVLNRCIEKDLVLNWEKCHFMVHKGLSLGTSSPSKALKLTKQRLNSLLSCHPQKCQRSKAILGHAGFYRRFIKDFSKLARPLCELLVKDAKFIWDDRCQRSFEELKLFLTTAPIVRAPNWQLPFEVMCDASDFAIGAVLGQREDGKPYVIYYASKTLNEAQRNYTTTEKELLAYLLTKQDAKARLIRWILLLQEFNLQIKDKKGVENVVADHLSRLAIAHNSHGLPINDDFPEESLMLVEVAPLVCSHCNYLVTGEVPSEWKAQDKKHFFAKIHAYYWEEPFLFNPCKHNDHRVVLKFLKENIFSRFGVPKAIISDEGTHFCNKPFETLLAKYGVKHKVATPYHPQTSGQVELANQEIKNILMKVVNTNRKDCLWQSMSSPVELEYKAWWAIKKLNMDLSRAGLKRFLDLNELEELRNDAYINSKLQKRN